MAAAAINMVEITNNTILKPCSTSPRPHPLTGTLVPLTIFDRVAMDLHVPTIYAFRAPMPSNSELKRGLAQVLAHYPHLSGRRALMVTSNDDDEGRQPQQPCFLLNNAGVRLVEASVCATLAEKLPLEESTQLTDLHPPVDVGVGVGVVEELLQVQLNRYTCGGLVIGVTSHHRVADGQSMSQFLVAWADTVRNNSTPLPYLDRAATVIPRNPPHSEFNHLDIEFRSDNSKSSKSTAAAADEVVNFVSRFSADFIQTLKSKVSSTDGVVRCSTFECLLAHLWRKITEARGVEEEETTQVRIAVNGRARMKPAVPMELFGNLVLWAHPKARAGQLLRSDHQLAHAVSIIRNAVRGIDDAYFKSFIDFGDTTASKLMAAASSTSSSEEDYSDGGCKSSTEEEEEEGDDEVTSSTSTSTGSVVGSSAPESGSALCPNLEVDSWLRFNFHDLDFGSGGPCQFLPPNLPVEGLMVFVPSCKDKGAVDVFMALYKEHARIFNNICYHL